MKPLRRAGIAGLGLIALAWASAQPAVAQYYGGQGYGYERRSGEGYERRSRDGYQRRDYERRDSQRYDDRGPRYGSGGGYGRDDGRGRGYGRQQNPMAGMTIEEQKRAVKNEREAQKKAIKRGQLFR
ncbi:hypothetical protein [Bosea beijingensis]|uniref:hypothetical protein n=1 Tax=Bosea beijingensis TaxID=3068632 RepID=UPI00274173E8|nr:hypothetical protein [Bosea sp. REN20]